MGDSASILSKTDHFETTVLVEFDVHLLTCIFIIWSQSIFRRSITLDPILYKIEFNFFQIIAHPSEIWRRSYICISSFSIFQPYRRSLMGSSHTGRPLLISVSANRWPLAFEPFCLSWLATCHVRLLVRSTLAFRWSSSHRTRFCN